MQRRRSLLLLSLLALAACGTQQVPEPPEIRFIGIATGTLVTDVRMLGFRDTFTPADHELVAVVGFAEQHDGATVQATWFSPDDRRMPMGRTSIVMQSGATIARFQLKNTQDWEPAPYMLDVRAWQETKGEEAPRTASGQLHFFIGLKTEDIQAYMQELNEWRNREKERAAIAAAQEQAQEELATIGRDALEAPGAVAITISDALRPERQLTVVLDTANEEPFLSPELTLKPVRQFAIVDGSGSVLLAMKVRAREKTFSVASPESIPSSAQTLLSVLPSGTVSVTWQEETRPCGVEFLWNGTTFARGAGNCADSL